MGVISPEQRERAHQKSRLTNIRRRVERYTTGEPAPTAEDRWTLAMDAVAGWPPPTPEVRDFLRVMLDLTADEVPS